MGGKGGQHPPSPHVPHGVKLNLCEGLMNRKGGVGGGGVEFGGTCINFTNNYGQYCAGLLDFNYTVN